MALRGRWRRWVKFGLAAMLLAGCSKNSGEQVGVTTSEQKSPTVNISPASNTAAETNDAKPDRLHQSFADACTTEINADSGVALPPTYTITQKNCGQLNEQIQKTWNDIKFTGADGKRQTYLLTLEVVQAE